MELLLYGESNFFLRTTGALLFERYNNETIVRCSQSKLQVVRNEKNGRGKRLVTKTIFCQLI